MVQVSTGLSQTFKSSQESNQRRGVITVFLSASQAQLWKIIKKGEPALNRKQRKWKISMMRYSVFICSAQALYYLKNYVKTYFELKCTFSPIHVLDCTVKNRILSSAFHSKIQMECRRSQNTNCKIEESFQHRNHFDYKCIFHSFVIFFSTFTTCRPSNSNFTAG